ASGILRAANRNGIPDWTPNARASYEAVLTTPRLLGSPSPPTTTDRPRNSGCRNTSTAARNWSRSTWSTRRPRLACAEPMGAYAPMLAALGADGPAAGFESELALFGQFVGSWELDRTEYTVDGRVASVHRGEWHFGWVLGGRAIQDVWICP